MVKKLLKNYSKILKILLQLKSAWNLQKLWKVTKKIEKDVKFLKYLEKVVKRSEKEAKLEKTVKFCLKKDAKVIKKSFVNDAKNEKYKKVKF